MSPKINNNLPPDKDARIAQLEQALVLEAALEKVRVRTMTMQKSTELADVASLVFQLLKELKVVETEDRFHFSLHDEKTGISRTWLTEANGHKIVQGFDFPLAQLPPLVKKVFNRWKNTPLYKRKELAEGTIYKGKELDDFIALMLSNPIFAKEKSIQAFLKSKPDQMVQNQAFFSLGVLVVTSIRQFAQQELQLLQRFASVFEQTYTRFLDLQKAEEQAREAQIEAALERVRAASMAMHKSEDLSKVVKVLFTQFQELNIEIVGAYIGIFHLEEHYVETWFSPINGVNEEPFFVKQSSIPWEETTIKDWKEGKDLSYISVIGKEATMQFAKYLQTLMNTDVVIKMVKELQIERIETTEANHQYGNLAITQNRKATTEEKAILKRFAKVFEQTYTRFLDLQKAEEQAREAQIEAALERVRAASMAMHKREDLLNVTTAIFHQLKALELDFIQSWISIFDFEQQLNKVWSSSLEGVIEQPYYAEYPITEIPAMETVVEKWKSRPTFTCQSYQGKELTALIEATSEFSGLPYAQQFHQLHGFQSMYITDANHQFGNLGLGTIDEAAGAATKEILKRFSLVFEQAYIRFLDIEKAEEQAREAQIEASLERIRAASMAMHHSDELTQVCQVFLSQIEHLAIPLLGVSIAMMNEDTRNIMQYVVDNTKKNQEPSLYSFEYNIDEFSITAEYIELAKKGNTEFSMSLGKKRIVEWIAWVGKFMGTERAERLKKSQSGKDLFPHAYFPWMVVLCQL